MIYIRTDANQEVASGHVMRCLTIANKLLANGENVCFVTSDHESDVLLDTFVGKHIVLNKDYKNLEDEISLYDSVLSFENRKDIILVDSYFATAYYLRKLKEKFIVAYFDDEHKDIYDVDILINYNLYYTLYDYEKEYPFNCKLLLGGNYVPLRDQFKGIDRPSILKKRPDVLIIVGGADKFHIIKYILENRNKYLTNDYQYHFIVGKYNTDKNDIYKLSKNIKNIYIYDYVKEIADLMSRCDIAISAASTFLYEACACSLPTVYFSIADNQSNDCYGFENAKVHLYSGDIRDNLFLTIDNSFMMMDKLLNNQDEYCKMRERLKSVVDGIGAERIARVLMDKKKNSCFAS